MKFKKANGETYVRLEDVKAQLIDLGHWRFRMGDDAGCKAHVMMLEVLQFAEMQS